MADDLVLGIDAGGSKTLLAVATREGEVVTMQAGGGVNPFDRPDWRSELDDVLGRLGDLRPALVAAAAGMPGHGELAHVSGGIEAALADLLTCPHVVVNDVQAAFDGAFPGRAGVLILAGTGSMAWAQNGREGATPVRVGGWGHEIGDEGSAFWVGRRAIALVSQTLDGRVEATPFAHAILTGIGVSASPGQTAGLLGWYHGVSHPRSAVAGLARHVSHLAENDDATAQSVMAEAADLLSAHVSAARRRIADRTGQWSHAGGLFNSTTLRLAMTVRLGPATPPALPPVGGALWRAARLAGWTVDAGWITRLAAGLQAFTSPSVEMRVRA